MAVTWNPSDKAANIVLSGDNLIATTSGAVGSWRSVRATVGKSSGKWYWEITINFGGAEGTLGVGISNLGGSLTQEIGDDATSWGFTGKLNASEGRKNYNSVASAYGVRWYDTDIIGIALDMDAGKIWIRVNGVWHISGDPEAGTNPAFSGVTGTMYPTFSGLYIDPTENQVVLNAGATAFADSAPSGFLSLEPQIIGFISESFGVGDVMLGYSLTGRIEESFSSGDDQLAQSMTRRIAESFSADDALTRQMVWENADLDESLTADDAMAAWNMTARIAESFGLDDTWFRDTGFVIDRNRFNQNITGQHISIKFQHNDLDQIVYLEDLGLGIGVFPKVWGQDQVNMNLTSNHISLKLQHDTLDEILYLQTVGFDIFTHAQR